MATSKASKKSRLGRGLGGLISGSGGKAAPAKKAASSGGSKASGNTGAGKRAARAAAGAAAPDQVAVNGYRDIPVARIDPNPYQPRRDFDPGHLEELMESIRSEGLLQPIVVRPAGERYQLIAGERRWRACQALQMRNLPARVIEASDASSASISLIENLQREGLNPIEEAMGYASLMRDFDLTQEAVAERVGKGRATIANGLRLLQLDEEIQGYLSRGMLSTGHSKVLLGVETGESRLMLARRVIEDGLSVRALEKAVEQLGRSRRSGSGARTSPSSEVSAVRDLENRISAALNARVTLKHSPKRGRLIIEYHGNDDLSRIMEKIGIGDSVHG